MAGLRPFFISGCNAKIKLNNRTLAFCTDFTYSVQILTQTPKVLGMFEGSSVEPLGYTVNGTFSVIRYVKDAHERIKGAKPHGISPNDDGNGTGNWGGASGKIGNNDGRANEALDPSKFANGTTFDIQVYQKTPNGDLTVANIRNARIVGADFGLTKRGIAQQRFTFVALYADEDSFVADFSGNGQHFEG